MSRFSTALSSGVLIALASPVLADLSANDVWADLKAYMELSGYTVTADSQLSGDTLSLSDVILTMAIPESSDAFAMELGTLTLTDQGDTVDIAFPSVMPIRFSLSTAKDEEASGVVEYRHSGFTMSASGTPNDLTYVYGAQSITFALTDLKVDGRVISRDEGRFDVTLEGIEGQSTNKTAEKRFMEQVLKANELRFDGFFSDQSSENTSGQLSGSFKHLDTRGTSSIPLDFDPADPAQLFDLDFNADGSIRHQGSTLTMNFTDEVDGFAFDATTGPGHWDVSINDGGIAYDTETTDIAANLTTSAFPLPFAMNADRSALRLKGPLSKSDTAKDVDLHLTLAGFEMSDVIWNMFDPAKTLPRDGATVDFDLSGKGKWLIDLMSQDPEAFDDVETPFEMESVTLKSLTVDAVGALLTGSGAFTFDNTDLQTFAGMPRPEGALTLKAEGANKLIETLVSMGILPEDQAMGARMFMAMFAKPVGDDVLESQIEINKSGHVLANGQRIQ